MDTQTRQTDSLSYIPAALFVGSQLIYNFYHVSKSVNWAIFYFSSIYIVLISWTVIEYLRTNDKLSKLYHVGIGMGLSFLIYLEINSKIAEENMKMDEYAKFMNEVNSKENSLLFALVMLIIMTTILSRLWKK